MSYTTRKARNVRFQLLADAGCPLATPRKERTPWPLLKEKLDHDFSELARMSRADQNGNVTCIDGCGKTGFWKDFDCGHFADRDNLPTRWFMPNCWPQAQECNRFKAGKRYEFGRALNAMVSGMADGLLLKAKEPADQIRNGADELLLDIRAKLKIERKRLKGVTR